MGSLGCEEDIFEYNNFNADATEDGTGVGVGVGVDWVRGGHAACCCWKVGDICSQSCDEVGDNCEEEGSTYE